MAARPAFTPAQLRNSHGNDGGAFSRSPLAGDGVYSWHVGLLARWKARLSPASECIFRRETFPGAGLPSDHRSQYSRSYLLSGPLGRLSDLSLVPTDQGPGR